MFSWFTRNTKAALVALVAALGAIGGAIAMITPDHTIADKAGRTAEQLAPVVADAINQIPAADEATDGGR